MNAGFLSELKPVHVKGLEALLSPADEAFFRKHLSPLQMMKVKAHRAWAADDYISRLIFNASAIGNRAAQFWDTATPEMKTELGEIADAAMSLRTMLFRLRVRTWASVFAPVDLGFDPAGYAQILSRAMRVLEPAAVSVPA